MATPAASGGMRVFVTVWIGQLVSTIGSGLTGFALGVWIYEKTGSVSLFALNIFAFTLATLLVSPLAGALTDRWDRRLVMIMSDTGAGLSTLAVALLLHAGLLQIWHIYVATAINAAFTSFQWPAYSAATTLLVPKRHLGRAGGMVQIGEAASQLISPAIAGALFVTAGLSSVIWIDFATFLFAVFTLLLVRFPRPEVTAEGQAGKGSLLKEAAFGWKYVTARPGLLGLLLYFASVNFLFGMISPLISPMILDMSSPAMLGYIGSIIGLGMLVGTLVMSAWGGPKRRIHGLLGFGALAGLFMSIVGVRPSIPLIAVGGFAVMFCIPILNASSQALWQSKVAQDIQGRVFAVRRMIAGSTSPLAILIAGPLADRVFEPLLAQGGPLAGNLGRVLGVGPGRGTGLMFILLGLLSILAAGIAYLHPRIRLVEDELPDSVPATSAEAEGLAEPQESPALAT